MVRLVNTNVYRAIEPARRGLLSLRDPPGPTYRSVPAHADGPPGSYPHRRKTDAPGGGIACGSATITVGCGL
jgi:hypothetical protein